MSIFKGAGVAIVTPMKSDLEVNYDKLAELLEEQIAGKTDAIIICGTTGESATMSEEEHSKVIRFAIERVNHRIPVIAGTGSNSTRTAIQLSQEAAKDGADGLLLVTPYYNKATQNGLIAHYTQICNSVDIPAILYNVPSRTGCAIQPTTVAHLVKNVDNIVGIKEASGDISVGAKIMHLCDGNIDLYSGNDDQVVPLLSLGGIGVISVLSNVAPTYVHDMVTKYLSGDTAGSCKMQLDALPICDALFCEVNESMKAYGVGTHRHTPEIEEQLGYACGRNDLKLIFTPHLVPMNRGILVTAYANLAKDVTYEEVKAVYDKYYKEETFVRVLERDVCPETRWVEGSNFVDIGFKIEPRTHRLIMMGALDNLVKGAAGQAVQNMNLLFGLPETEGLMAAPMFP